MPFIGYNESIFFSKILQFYQKGVSKIKLVVRVIFVVPLPFIMTEVDQ